MDGQIERQIDTTAFVYVCSLQLTDFVVGVDLFIFKVAVNKCIVCIRIINCCSSIYY